MTIAFADGRVITGDGRILEHATVVVEDDKIADLIMVSGNPLENIDILLEREFICLVMQGGKIVANGLI